MIITGRVRSDTSVIINTHWDANSELSLYSSVNRTTLTAAGIAARIIVVLRMVGLVTKVSAINLNRNGISRRLTKEMI